MVDKLADRSYFGVSPSSLTSALNLLFLVHLLLELLGRSVSNFDPDLVRRLPGRDGELYVFADSRDREGALDAPPASSYPSNPPSSASVVRRK